MAEPITIWSDRDLIGATRRGDDAAWSALVSRHEPAITRVARSMKGAGASKRSSAALDEVHRSVVAGEIDHDAVVTGAPQLRDVRCRGLAALTGGTVGPMLPPPSQRHDDVRRTETPDRQDLVALAAAFLETPWAWQTALWHGRAERRSATEIGPLLGRSANDVNATVLGAEAGLFELYLRADASRIADLDPTSAALLPLIGGHRRNVLSPSDRRRVDELLERRTEGDPAGLHAARWVAVGGSLESMIPQALVPGLVGQSVERFWAVLGVGGAAVGTAALAAARSERVQRMARIGAVAAIIVAILGAAFLIRNPFDGLDASLISDLDATSSSVPGDGPTDGDTPADGDGTDVPKTTDPVPGSGGGYGAGGLGSAGDTGSGGNGGADGTGGGVDPLDDRINLVFPGARQGAVYVPGQELLRISAVLSAESEFVAGGTGSLGLAITNDDDKTAYVRFEIRPTAGIRLVSPGDGSGTCRTATSRPASCSITLGPGATASLTLVFGLDADLTGNLEIVPSIPGRALTVPIV
ncbi:MAG: hypothetical protein ABWZ99_07230 [Ilumatobacteraceae bacterium]